MENKWSIIPSDGGATIDENGKATFPKNTSPDDKTYIITYNDECSASATVIQNGAECEDFNFTSPSSSETLSFTSHSNVLIATTDKDFCDLRISGNLPSFITSTSKTQSNTDKEYRANINANMSGSQRNGKVKFIPTDTDFDCSFSATVVQDSVTCDNYGFTAITNSIGYADGSTGHVASSNSSLAALTASTKPTWVRSVTSTQSGGVWKYIATVDENTTTSPKSGDIVFAPSDSEITCPDKFKTTVNQKALDCAKYGFSTTAVTVANTATSAVLIAESNSSANELTVKSKCNWLTTSSSTSGSKRKYYVTPTQHTGTSNRTCNVVYESSDGCEFQAAKFTQTARDCNRYEFNPINPTVEYNITDNTMIATSKASEGALSVKSSSCDWVTTSSAMNGSVIEYYAKPNSQNTSNTARTCDITYKSDDGCENFVASITQNERIDCSNQWKFTSGSSITSGWYVDKPASPNGLGGLGVYIWSGGTEYIKNNPTNDFQAISDNEQISCEIHEISHINNNYYMFSIDFKYNITQCDWFDNNYSFNITIQPTACTEVTDTKFKCNVTLTQHDVIIYSTEPVSTTQSPMTLQLATRVKMVDGTYCNNRAGSIAVPQISVEHPDIHPDWKAEWKVNDANTIYFDVLDVVGIGLNNGNNYNARNYCATAFELKSFTSTELVFNFDPNGPTSGCPDTGIHWFVVESEEQN